MPQVHPQMLRLLAVEECQLPSAHRPGSPPPCSLPSPPAKLLFQPPGHPKQALIDGELWPPVFQAQHVRSAKKMMPLATDVFVCTYPKCGTTWIQHICSQLLYNADYGPRQSQELCVTSPMIERMGAAYCDGFRHPRLLKTHFSRPNCPKASSAAADGPKYIFAARNPKDCCVSYFHHNRNFKIYDWAEGQFDVFFELFMQGKLAFGDYFEYLRGWLPHLEDPNVLFLKYEDMLADLEGTVRKIGQFLGGGAAKLVADKECLGRIVAESNIDAMKRDQGRWFPGSALHRESFIRKGASRDWKNHMSREQSERMDRLFRTKLAGTVAQNWWHAEMRWEVEEDKVEEEEQDSGMESDGGASNDGADCLDLAPTSH